MRNTLLIILFAAISISASCQKKKYKNAYVVTLSGDTISGLIHKKNKVSLCHGIKFVGNDNLDSPIHYNPSDISSFCFTNKNKSYKSLKYKNNSKELIPGFGELLFDDEIKLYKFYQSSFEVNGVKYVDKYAYVIENDSMSYILTETRSGRKTNAEAFHYDNKFEYTKSYNPVLKEYLGMLNIVFMDCPKIRESISKVNFNDHELIGIIKNYIKCKRANSKLK